MIAQNSVEFWVFKNGVRKLIRQMVSTPFGHNYKQKSTF